MLWTIAVVLVILWLLGFIGMHAFGYWIHILLVVALVVIIIGALQGRRAL